MVKIIRQCCCCDTRNGVFIANAVTAGLMIMYIFLASAAGMTSRQEECVEYCRAVRGQGNSTMVDTGICELISRNHRTHKEECREILWKETSEAGTLTIIDSCCFFLNFMAAAVAACGAYAFKPKQLEVQLWWIPFNIILFWVTDFMRIHNFSEWGMNNRIYALLFVGTLYTSLQLWLMLADFSLIKLINTQEISRDNHPPLNCCGCGNRPQQANGQPPVDFGHASMRNQHGIQMQPFPVVVEAQIVHTTTLPQADSSQVVQATVVAPPAQSSAQVAQAVSCDSQAPVAPAQIAHAQVAHAQVAHAQVAQAQVAQVQVAVPAPANAAV